MEDRICRTCHWSRYRWCSDSMKIANLGDCEKWKLIKLSDAAKNRQATVQKAAHKLDQEKRKSTRSKRKATGTRGGA
jgi:hypothetical protein